MILLIGIANSQLVELAKLKDINAVLLTEDNSFNRPRVGYSGIEEFHNKKLFLDLLLSAKEIFYHPETFDETKFNCQDPTATSRGLTENFLLFAKQQGVKVHNLSLLGQDTIDKHLAEYLKLADIRKDSSGPQIWGVGCSFTYGSGVNVEQRYINVLGKKLNMPVNCLALPGTSIKWAADQILRSDIRKGDLVVWGLTSKHRLPLVHNNTVGHASIYWIDLITGFDKKFLVQLLSDEENLNYQQFTCINQVINFCDKISAKIVLLGILTLPIDQLYLHSNPHFYQCSNDYVDLGSDNEHPGPKQHQIYADIVYNQIQKGYNCDAVQGS